MLRWNNQCKQKNKLQAKPSLRAQAAPPLSTVSFFAAHSSKTAVLRPKAAAQILHVACRLRLKCAAAAQSAQFYFCLSRSRQLCTTVSSSLGCCTVLHSRLCGSIVSFAAVFAALSVSHSTGAWIQSISLFFLRISRSRQPPPKSWQRFYHHHHHHHRTHHHTFNTTNTTTQ